MALKSRTRPYEFLIRFGPQGFQGAHVIDVEEIIDGETVKAATELPARAVTEAEMGEILGKETARLIESADAANDRAEVARQEASAAREATAAAEKALANAVEQRDELSARLVSTSTQLAEAREVIGLAAQAAEIRASVNPEASAVHPTATVVGDLPAGSEIGADSVVMTDPAALAT